MRLQDSMGATFSRCVLLVGLGCALAACLPLCTVDGSTGAAVLLAASAGSALSVSDPVPASSELVLLS